MPPKQSAKVLSSILRNSDVLCREHLYVDNHGFGMIYSVTDYVSVNKSVVLYTCLYRKCIKLLCNDQWMKM